MSSNARSSHEGGTHPSRAPVGPVRRFTCCFALVVLGTAATISCERPVEPDAGSVSLSIAPTGATFVQNGSQPVTATLTRLGGFSGSVGFTVSGVPSGITAAVSDVQTTGAVTTATIMVVVGAGVAPGVYPLVVHGTARGVSEATQAFRLTVAALGAVPPPPPMPSYTLTLSATTLSIAQANGGGPPYTAVNLVRTNFTGPVAVSVESLPTGVHFAYPDTPMSGSSAVLGLVVAPDAPTGTFANVLVRGVAAGLSDQTAPLTLTITEAPFTLALSSPTLSIVQGGASQTTTVNIVRNNFTDAVELFVDWWDSMPPGITGAFAPSVTGGNTSVLSLSASAEAVPGVYDLYVFGVKYTPPPPLPWWVGVPTYCCVPLKLTVLSP